VGWMACLVVLAAWPGARVLTMCREYSLERCVSLIQQRAPTVCSAVRSMSTDARCPVIFRTLLRVKDCPWALYRTPAG
jgi:hypothetical protein